MLPIDPIFKGNSLKSASLVTNVIKESEEKASINLFPNPANNRFTVTCNESLQSITLLDIAGDVVLEFCDLHTKTHTFDIFCINQGVYVVKTITQNGYEKWINYLKKNSILIVLFVLFLGSSRCGLIFEDTSISPEKPTYLKIGDTIIFESTTNVDPFYVEDAKLYQPGEIENDNEKYVLKMDQIDCTDSCCSFVTNINLGEYRARIYGFEYSSYVLADYDKRYASLTLQVGGYKLGNLYVTCVKKRNRSFLKRTVPYFNVPVSNLEIDLSGMEKGVYFVDLVNNGNVLGTQKLIKQ